MITRLPRWVWGGACFLAAIAGAVNAVALLGLEHKAVSHVTGTATHIGVSLSAAGGGLPYLPVALPVGLLLAFLIGAVLSGMLIRDSALRFGRSYGVALLIEAGLLALAVPLLQRGWVAGDLLAAAACGLQNAMATTYSGAVVRTTHVSGVVTDLGLTLGQFLAGRGLDTRRLGLHAMILMGFILGGALGAQGFTHWKYSTLYVPALACGCAGAGYMLTRLLHGRATADEAVGG